MSFKIAAKVWDFGNENCLDHSTRFLLMALADSACDQTLECWPGVKLLSYKTGLSERTIKTKLSDLTDRGIISRRRTRNNSGQLGKYVYRLDFALETNLPAKSANGETLGATIAPSQKPGANDVSPRCNLASKPGATIAPHNLSLEPIKEPIKEKPKKAEKKTVKIELPSWLDPDAWDEFREHRKFIKKPMSAHSEKLNLNQLTALRNAGHDYRKVINNSIANGWKGFFELKKSPQNKNIQESRDDRMVVGSSEWDEYEKRADAYRLECEKNRERMAQEYRDSLNN